MNYMKEIAQMLGVRLDEKFKIKNCNAVTSGWFFTEEGLCCEQENTALVNPNPTALTALLCGKTEIVKKPWQPDYWQEYYFIAIMSNETFEVKENTWYGTVQDYTGLACGNCFKTRDEAEAAIPWFKENIERIKRGEIIVGN